MRPNTTQTLDRRSPRTLPALAIGLACCWQGVARADDRPRAESPHEPARLEAAEAPARLILDDTKGDPERLAAVEKHVDLSAELIATMARGLGPDPKEEYRRIPWIWRVAIAAGRRNDEAEMLRILKASLPDEPSPLRDWQAVVVGGGIINGLTLVNVWPAERLDAILIKHPDVLKRWRHAIDLASAMADDTAVPAGTRYDALRMLGVQSWDHRGAQLFRYLLKGTHPELQQGAVCALGDVPSPSVPQALLSGFDTYSDGNRAFVIEALLRDDLRRTALLDALESGRLKRGDLGADAEALLLDPKQNASSDRAKALLAK